MGKGGTTGKVGQAQRNAGPGRPETYSSLIPRQDVYGRGLRGGGSRSPSPGGGGGGSEGLEGPSEIREDEKGEGKGLPFPLSRGLLRTTDLKGRRRSTRGTREKIERQ